ncbi:thioredoxin reductase [Saccharopolyspora erythraea NRRL 2338]|uniref:Pyridine nucleotide-disulphide oxidoreductase n=2 Tax=Saccharopolyspora erythraea TaxID=1836 RepID=A4FEQ0_SACEN|nr:FAD-dependent oxidoreductase [Saccharopolyspora erythraea]EQD83186.1 ferredoxin [Saccharopolyspora erythraea D]PFG96250.1 thioredoxin reductase [Saccharopolyspora erythraea NRRL 2338]QRK92772.1 FAD-dependent oxidoreductase [Saccharopolyspora erythraea]CAM02525.1 pyridine nucleotide-disulphide oxidoreductase [Saccharopolyspora erythraea NRRL 2338]
MTVVVVGAGPAGIAAAGAAARAGVRVVLVDAAARPGGQYHRQNSLSPEGEFGLPEGVEHLADSSVWAVEPIDGGHRVHVRTGRADGPGRRGRRVDTPALVLATGAYDRALPFPGWTLPGVYTAGAAQALVKGQGVAVGDRVLLAGTGPFLLPVAESLLDAGAGVLGVFEAGRPFSRWLRDPRGMFAGRGKLAELARYARVLAANGVPYRTRTTVIAAHGVDRVEEVTTARLDPDWNVLAGTEQRVRVDAVCVGFGFTPQLELAVAARCKLHDGFVLVDAAQATSVPGVFAAGEITGIGGAEPAAAEGEVAGTAAAVRLGARPPVPHRALRAVRHGRRFAAALARAHPVRPGWQGRLADDTLVCRCEEVDHRELREAVGGREASGARSLKLVSRVGLGPCQGRICGPNVADLVPGIDPAALARRPVAVPVRLAELSESPAPQEETE